jgi:hypothetical protein
MMLDEHSTENPKSDGLRTFIVPYDKHRRPDRG